MRLSGPGARRRGRGACASPTGGRRRPRPSSEAQALVAVGGREARLTLPLGERPRPWSLEDPYLYDATLTLTAGGDVDRVKIVLRPAEARDRAAPPASATRT